MTMVTLIINEKNSCLEPAHNLIKKQDSNKTCFKAIGQYITHEGKLWHDKT